jgi:hypothetical protein
MKEKLLTIFLFAFTCPLFAQSNLQLKTLTHGTIQINQHWFVAGWNVTNIQQNSPDNTNLMLGGGYQKKNWWTEVMIQKQWSKVKTIWSIDLRTQINPNKRLTIFLDISPSISQESIYNTTIVELAMTRKMKLGIESDNLIQTGQLPKSGFGPRINFGPFTAFSLKPSMAIAYQFRRNDPNFLRMYLVLPIPF